MTQPWDSARLRAASTRAANPMAKTISSGDVTPPSALRFDSPSILLLVAAIGALAATLVFWAAVVPSLPAHSQARFAALELRRLPWVTLNPLGYLGFALVFVLEWWIPANPRQPIASRGLLQDLGWAAIATAWKIIFLTGYVVALRAFVREHLSFLLIDSAAAWPAGVRFTVAVLIDDFIGWGNHWLRHKVPALWHLHAVHHSQRELNVLSDLRNHPLEQIVKETAHVLTFILFGAPLTLTAAYPLIRSSFTRFYHANIRTNLGWLRFVLVTPQSHRVHHSVEERHRDKNFGTTFCIWDRLFGTAYLDCTEYPVTGIHDPRFVHEQDRPLTALPTTFVEQLLYPLRAWSHLIRAARTRAHATHPSRPARDGLE